MTRAHDPAFSRLATGLMKTRPSRSRSGPASACYGFGAARLAGESLPASALRALAAALIGAFLVALKALLH
jgi:hypothetical protein